MSITQISWSDIENKGKPTGKYICSQYLDALLRHGKKEAALAHKFIARPYAACRKITMANKLIVGPTLVLDVTLATFCLSKSYIVNLQTSHQKGCASARRSSRNKRKCFAHAIGWL